eukprot:Selendium_serpulae@DN6327_c3_g1_i6.p1
MSGMGAVPSSLGTAKNAGLNDAVAWVNEVLYNAAKCTLGTAAGEGLTGFEVISLEAGEYHLLVGDAALVAATTSAAIVFTEGGVQWIDPTMFTPEPSLFSSGYAILTSAAPPHTIFSAISWGLATPAIEVALPDGNAFTAVPLVLTPGSTDPLAMEVGGTDMTIKGEGTWSERTDDKCSPGALNDGQTVAGGGGGDVTTEAVEGGKTTDGGGGGSSTRTSTTTTAGPGTKTMTTTTRTMRTSTTTRFDFEKTDADDGDDGDDGDDDGGAIGNGLHGGLAAMVVMTYLWTG